MYKTALTLPPEKLAIFARLAHVLEEASSLAWEISVGNPDVWPTLPKDMDDLEKTDSALADTMALMFNEEAKEAIQESVTAMQQGRVRPAREFFDEV